MIVEKSLTKAGLTMEGDKLPQKDRTVKTFQRLIAAVRATEGEVMERLSNAERELNDSLRANLTLQERCHKLEAELRHYKVAEVTGTMEALTTADRTKLLEVA
jgi:hypothetical protein